jgi:hypothetical protein
MKTEPNEKSALAREAALRLSEMGGTMPDLQSIPRMRSEPAEHVDADNPAPGGERPAD